jgi:hypothetical protein
MQLALFILSFLFEDNVIIYSYLNKFHPTANKHGIIFMYSLKMLKDPRI